MKGLITLISTIQKGKNKSLMRAYNISAFWIGIQKNGISSNILSHIFDYF
jgi:hypothetical protein